MKSDVCAIIVTYNAGKKLLACLRSIKHQVEEVVFVDNGSDEETVSLLNDIGSTYDGVKIFYNPENLGIAAALNIGVRYCLSRGYKWILTLDHDSEATPDLVEKLVGAYEELRKRGTENIAIVAANLFDTNIRSFMTRQEWFKGDDVRQGNRALTSGSLFNAAVFEQVGFFNDDLFIYYVDDDFCLRCTSKGWGIYKCRSAVLLHQEGVKEVREFLWKKFIYRNYDSSARYYISRNAVHMAKSYLRHGRYYNCWKIAERLSSQAVRIVLFGKNRGILLRFMLKGLFDGIMGKYGRIDAN